MNQNIKIYESFQIKRISRGIIVLMIMATLMKVRWKPFAWLSFTFSYQNTSAQSLILLNFFSSINTLA